MKNKPADVIYCGVRKDVIDNAEPYLFEDKLDMFMEYIQERYNIHLKKDVYLKKPPYTDNNILNDYRFTNVRREHDYETKWLITQIHNSAFTSYKDKLLNTILFRMFNKHETMEIIGAPIAFSSKVNSSTYIKRLREYEKEHKGCNLFTTAFLTCGLKTSLKAQYSKAYDKDRSFGQLVCRAVSNISMHRNLFTVQEAENQQEVHNIIKEINGIGDFLAYQIFVDFTYLAEFPFSENEFTVAGPGCKKGIDYLFRDKGGMTYEECVFWIRDNWDYLMNNFISEEFRFDCKDTFLDLHEKDRVMNVMSIENCFCEFSKYVRLCEGNTIKKRYRPRNG